MAANARPYVTAAAAAGYQVLAADVFGDEDTLAASASSMVLEYGHNGFSLAAIRHELIPALQRFGADMLLYGSGFEAQPEVLDVLAAQLPLVGNQAPVVKRCKDAHSFLTGCQALDIPVPDSCFNRELLEDNDRQHWLYKEQGGSGGMHIQLAAEAVDDGGYFQRKVPGVPVSLLFLASAQGITPVGFQRQLLAPLDSRLPYRYGGLVGPIKITGPAAEGLLKSAQLLAFEFGLRGLNSLDAMIDGDQYWILEINPRLSASLALYEMPHQWLQAHIDASLEHDVDWPSGTAGQPRANLVCYSPFDIEIPCRFNWPEWVVDKPLANSVVVKGAPLCTVVAVGESDGQAEELARTRAVILNEMLKYIQTSGEEHESSHCRY
ncbi:ATP-grasp domain-containing protein [Methylobacillus gramineus]|uniref:ATP-grasp domain-containing protein n=1 Tax=Methylobacillus gramineus TaxID=755169 RepID=UPI001CFFC0C1|nr:ATP-grasp domain-containing protein [Methylobacillus gramineus]MCB5184497.1 ATP-grasp domain-containing protein [Methylobacillus gramineus]